MDRNINVFSQQENPEVEDLLSISEEYLDQEELGDSGTSAALSETHEKRCVLPDNKTNEKICSLKLVFSQLFLSSYPSRLTLHT